MCILLLAQSGKLSLDDEVWKFLPEWSDREHRVTIRHLLTHTSGLREAFTLLGIAAARKDGVSVNDSIVKILARQLGVNSIPGEEFQYNNGAYNLLGSIVKRVSGQSLREFADANLFKPLGMTHTHFHDDLTRLIPNRVSGYIQGTDGFRLARLEGGVVGNSGLFTTPRDLLMWEQNFVTARVGTPALLAEMQKPAISTEWGDGSYYGFGLVISEYRGLRMIGHGGGDAGIAAYVARFPDRDLAVAVIANLDTISAMTLLKGVADIYLGDSFQSPAINAVTPSKVSLTPEQLADKAGLYRDDKTDILGRFFVRDGKLMASPDTSENNSVEIVPVAANRFVIPGTTLAVEFIPASKDHEPEAHVTALGMKPRISRKLTPYSITSKELQAYSGDYRSPEIETTYSIMARKTDLLIKMPGRSDGTLEPVFRDGFSGFGTIKFLRDKRERITGLIVTVNGVRKVRFDHVKR